MGVNDGGKAFPAITIRQVGDPAYCQPTRVYHGGMSLRDWFAGQALGHIPALLEANNANKTVEVIARWAYEVADSMLAERQQTTGSAEAEPQPEGEV